MKTLSLAILVVCGVVLLATGMAVADSASLTISGTVISAEVPGADFIGTPTSGYAPLIVSFSDLSTGSPVEWAWDFNNDTIIDAVLENPEYVYHVPGIYTVSLTVRNAAGADTEVKPGYITVREPDPVVRIKALRDYIRGLPLPNLTKTLLIMPLERALKQLEKGHARPAVNQMEVFLHFVYLMERFGSITPDQAAYMVGEGEEIIYLIIPGTLPPGY